MSRSGSDDSPVSEATPSAADGIGTITAEVDLEVPDVARYLVVRLLGTGGMGRVLAVRDRRLGREVAMKEPRAEVGDAALLRARLAREAWITARIEHPGVPPIYDAGTLPDGGVYYTMPIVRGRSLAERLSGADPAVRQGLLRRVLEAAEAVGAAHTAHTIHRDLKPANIMIGDDGATRVVDWGLAKVLGQVQDPPTLERERAHRRRSTGTGFAGTRLYMSPELLVGADADTRSDVWSLGAILYEVCVGSRLRPSVERDDIASPRVSLVRAGQPPELIAVIERALAPHAQRYPDAGAFAADLSRYLDGDRVSAHAYSARELLFRFVRLWRVPILVAVIALVVVAVLVGVGLVRLSREVDRALAAESESHEALAIADRNLAASLSSQALMSSQRGARAEAEVLAAASLAHSDTPAMRGVLLAWSAHRRPEWVAREPVPECLSYDFAPSGERLLCRGEATLSVWVGRPLTRLWQRALTTTSAVWWGEDVAVYTGVQEYLLLAGANGRALARGKVGCGDALFAAGDSLSAHSTICLWTSARRDSPGPGEESGQCAGSYISGAAVTADHPRWGLICENGQLVTGAFGRPSAEARTRHLRLPPGHVIMTMAFLDGERLALGSNRGEVYILDDEVLGPAVMTGRDQVAGLAASASGAFVVATGAVGAPLLIDTRAGLVVSQLPEGARRYLRFVGDELFDLRGDLVRWHPRPGPLGSFGVEGGVTSVAVDPNGERVAATYAGGVVVRRRADATLALSASGSNARGVPKAVAFSPDGRELYLAAGAYLLENGWHLSLDLPFDASSQQKGLRRIGALANGWLVAVPYDVGVHVYPPTEEVAWPELSASPHRFTDLAVAASGREAIVFEPSAAAVWLLSLDARSFEPRIVDPGTIAIAIGRDASLVATAGQTGASLWDAERGALIRHFAVPGRELVEIALAPDERYLAAGTKDGLVLVWEVASGALRAVVSAHAERVASLAFSPEGQTLASGGWDGRVRLYDLDVLDAPVAGLTGRLEAAWGVRMGEILARELLMQGAAPRAAFEWIGR